ncbi:MAG: hypothetical protein OXU29_03610 [Gammaproteobacteria bacterium]|nr:hypothetical protein [Gammaproteobacteria bacterium]
MYDEKMWVIHYTHPDNFRKIKKSGKIKSAWHLMRPSQRKQHAQERRGTCQKIGGAVLRDQKPLTRRIQFCDGAKFCQYVEYINQHVFFWPTRYAGSKKREAFRKKYAGDCEIRCRLCDLEKANPGKILYCRYNSGATPRQPEKHKRSRKMFQPLSERKKQPIVEVVIKGVVKLPPETKYKNP